jgi:hypothetical protein
MNLEGEVQAYYTVVKGEKQGNHAQFTRPPPLNDIVGEFDFNRDVLFFSSTKGS